jgi:hypothetical protein
MTVQRCQSKFNNSLEVSNDGSSVSSLGGMDLVAEFAHKIGLEKIIDQNVDYEEYRKAPRYSFTVLTIQFIFRLIAGYSSDVATNILRTDPTWRLIFKDGVSSQATVSRYLNNFQRQLPALNGLHQVSSDLADQYFSRNPKSPMLLDVDSTHFDTFGKQEGAEYNAHYEANGFHPFVVFDPFSHLLIDIQFRPGSVYTSTETAAFLEPVLARYADRRVTLRADSGFAVPAIYTALEAKNVPYVIRLKANSRLQDSAEKLCQRAHVTPSAAFNQCFSTIYKAKSWDRPRRIIIQIRQKEDELFPRFGYFVTTFTGPADTVVALYNQRGAMENYIKEAKAGYFVDKTDSSLMAANHARMILGAIAYNLVNLMRLLTFPRSERQDLIQTIRLRFLHVAGVVVHHARKYWLKLTSSNPFDRQFWQIFKHIQALT